MVEGYVDLEYFELPILIWNLMLAVCIVCKYEANFRELQRMSGIAQCSRQFVGGAGKAGRGIILLAVNAFVISSVTRKGVESARDVDGHALEPLEHIMQLAGSKMTNICICRLL